jgi:hypothetical protein
MPQVTVSDLFIEIYQDFNVFSVKDKLSKLSRKELLLMLVLATYTLDEDDKVFLDNCSNYSDELHLLYDSMDSNGGKLITTDPDLLQLIEESGDKNIDTGCIIDKDGKGLPKPLSESEALLKRRNVGIENILK